MTESRLEGRSLSLCVRDIIAGKVAEEDVSRIVAGISESTRASFEELLENYGEYYWQQNPAYGKEIALRFYDAGKIDQPLLRGEKYPNVANGHWKVIEYS